MRSNIEIYRGLQRSFTDNSNIQPYKTYTYAVRACNIEGCAESSPTTVATLEANPELVQAPVVIALNATALQLSWSLPGQPNGIIVQYHVYYGSNDIQLLASQMQLVISGLIPYTTYDFILGACSGAGCTNSSLITGRTMEAAPTGVTPPRAVIISSTVVELFWQEPKQANGIITSYRLYRPSLVYSGDGSANSFIDRGLTPGANYAYKLQVSTAAGSTESDQLAVQMPTLTPEGIPAPYNVTALSSSKIYVAWQQPATPNGVIDQYKIVLNAGSPTETEIGVLANVFSKEIDGLLPYTLYNVRIRACLQGLLNGCGTGPGVDRRTHEAPPQEQGAPTVTALGPAVVSILWELPARPNGQITKFEIRRRKFGETNEVLINVLQGDILSFTNAGNDLEPFTEYEYKVTSFNSAGQVTSLWSRVRTLEAVPENVQAPTVTAESAFAILVSWQLPLKPNGVITMYRIEYQELLNDPTLTPPTLSVTVHGNVYSTSFSGLKPFTDYKVRIVAVNTAGQTISPWNPTKTLEATPADVGPLRVEKISDGESVILSWDRPGKPNGIITTYRIYDEIDVMLSIIGLDTQYQYRRLQPYTEYSVLLEACTSAGCGRSALQTFITAEIKPRDQQVPTFGNSNSTHITIRWLSPITANGKIILYEVLREELGPVSKRAVIDPSVVYSTNETEAAQYQYIDGPLTPYTRYRYKIRSSNSIDSVESGWEERSTLQAPPGGVSSPTVEYFGNRHDELRITWSPPRRANGVIQSYQLQRNTSTPLSFSATDFREYIDRNLNAYTLYMYILTVCTAGGCTISDPSYKRTQETSPLYVNPPMVNAVNSTTILALWTSPQITNGQITHYQLKVDSIVVYSGLDFEFAVSGLIPYQQYRFVLTACTNGGCTDSNSVVVRPEESRPLGLHAPILRVLGSRAIEVTWRAPDSPNGVILSYELRRGGDLLYEGPNTNYTDFTLEPGTVYSYEVTATNSKGSVTSDISTAKTYSSSPEGLLPPVATPLTSTTVQATWQPPAKTNGDIYNYTLLKDDDVVFSGRQFSYIVPGLEFYTEYSFRIQSCTSNGCTTSTATRARTLAAPPIGMDKPRLSPQADVQGAHSGILVEWSAPIRPNGLVTGYKVYRRTLSRNSGTAEPSYGPRVQIYNGTAKTFSDTNLAVLKPYSEYQYMATAFNTEGSVDSVWETVRTLEAPPEGLLAPQVQPQATSLQVIIQEPTRSNGYINSYNVILNGTLVSSSRSTIQTVGSVIPLQPFTMYAVEVEACTAGGCTRSPVTLVQTTEANPSGLDPPIVVSINATAAVIQWSAPIYSNGDVRRYELLQRVSCPAPHQPSQITPVCSIGEPILVYQGLNKQVRLGGLAPYTTYEFQVNAFNDIGGVNQRGWTKTATLAALPQYVYPPKLQKNGTLVVVSWVNTFILNGELVEYRMYSNERKLYSGFDTSSSLERETKDKVYRFQVSVQTKEGSVSSPDIIFDPNAVDYIGGTTTGTIADPAVLPFYQEVWFIALIAVVVLLLLFTGIAFCLRTTGPKAPYVRERMPLQPRLRKDGSPVLYCVDPYDGSIITTDIARAPSHASLQHIRTGFVNPAYSHGSLPRSLPGSRSGSRRSSVVDLSEKMSKSSKYLDDEDDVVWDGYMPDSGHYDEDDYNGRPYSVTKEHTMFTDTHL